MKLGLYQICIQERHFKEELEPGFLVWDHSENLKPQCFEFQVFESMFDKKIYRNYDICGAVSYKFRAKTNITGLQFIEWIQSNPGYDLYFINPFPHIYENYHDLWSQGEISHPGIFDLAQELFDGIGYHVEVKRFPRLPARYWSYCNYWAASPQFWEEYIPLLKRITEYCETHSPERFFSKTLHAPVPAAMYAFIVERMLTTFLAFNKRIRFCSYTYPEHQIKFQGVNVLEQNLYENMKQKYGLMLKLVSMAPIPIEWKRQFFVHAHSTVIRRLQPTADDVARRF
jgi:hypothetical protein